ncbi:iron reductase [Gyrodon lividus]|nr:iron reductase [Gyrodon lividus]
MAPDSSSAALTDKTIRIHRSILYPEATWFCLAIFLLLVGLFQWGSLLHSKSVKPPRPNKGSDEESSLSSTRPRKTFSLVRLPLAAVNFYRVVAFRWTFEFGSYIFSMAEVFVTFAYVSLLLTCTFINTTDLEGKKFNIIYWSNRAGLLAASQFPLVTALGTKNNIVSLITGISYEKLNYVHRVTARSCFGLLLIHACGEIYSYESFQPALQEGWLRFGIAAVVALGILCIVSLRPIRTEAYEFFFYTHFVAVLIFLLGAYLHTNAVNHSYWIWPSFMFWALDRFMRVVRLVVSNHLYFSCNRHSGSGSLDATTELLCEDFVRVRLRRPPHFHWSPGQTAYIIMPSVSTLPFEAHPFSISSIDSPEFRQHGDDYSEGGEERTEIKPSGAAYWKELVFLVNVRGGFTKRLKEVAAENKTVKVFVDGPYGSSPDLGAYNTSVLIAGGTGVTYTLPVFLSVIEAARNGISNCRRVVFIWAVRDASHLHWISDALARAHSLAPSHLTVSIQIFATSGGIPSSESDWMGQDQILDKDREPVSGASWIMMKSGRPNLKAILREEVNEAVGRMSVSVCGSQGLARSVRHALRFPVSGPYSILHGGPSVTLYVESFGYA